MNSDLFLGVKKNKKEDKNQFLKAQKEARDQREQLKREQKSALKIQSLYRSAKTRERVVREFAADRLKKLGDVQKIKDKLTPQQFALVANKMFQYKGFLSFAVFLKTSNAKDYRDIILMLSDFLLCSLNSEDALFLNILNKNRETRISWYVKLKHILNCLLQVAFVEGGSKNGGMSVECAERGIAEKLLHKIIQIDKEMWPTLENSLVKNKELDISIRKELKAKLTSSISSKAIQSIIMSQEFKQSTFLRKFILKAAIDRQDVSNEGMFLELLSLQSFYKDVQLMSQEKRLKLVNFLVMQIEKEKLNMSKDLKFLERFIRELIEFLHFMITNHLLQGLDAKFFQNILDIISNYIAAYNSAMLALSENQKIIANSMEVEEEKGSPLKSPSKMKATEIKAVISKDPSMALSLDQTAIKHFCEVIAGIFNMFTTTDFDVFSTLIARGCETLILFKRSLRTNDKNLLKNILSFQLNFYYLPFMCIKRQGYNVKSMLFVPEKYIPIIKVFSEVLYQTLRITDDEEFMNNSEIVQSSWLLISKEDLIEIATFSNYLLYNIIWDRVVPYYRVVDAQVRLVRELYNRDSRLKYCPKNFWTIPELEAMTQTLLSDPGHLKIEALQDILDKVPHMLTFETRLKILHRMIEKDKEEYDRFPGFDPQYDVDDENNDDPTKDPKLITIHRQFLLEDGFEKISKRRDMRSIFMIRFVNEHGMLEEGIDGGGLLKEFITLIGKIAFEVDYGLFVENEDKTLMPNPNSYLHAEHLKLFNFLGRLTGKAIYEHILLESVFSVIFLNRILKIPNTINELKFADPTLYKNLMLLKHRNDVADTLHLTFSIDETALGNTRTHLLKPNGDKIEVNESNKLEYLSLFCDYKLNQAIKDQSQAFLNGLKSAIDLSWVKLFNHEELQYVISGIRKKGFSVEDLKANVEYRGFDLKGPTMTAFWEVLNEMSDDERSLFLLFVTGCSRPPTLGFKFMDPKIAIHNSSADINDIDKLPTASTCANLFKLPNYKNKELLKQKLLYAINAHAGFDLG